MSENKARDLDRMREVPEAIVEYENLIAGNKAEILDYLNLICIYFNCMDLGYASSRKISIEVERNSSTRALELLNEAEFKFGRNDELTYWKKIIPFYGWGENIGDWDLVDDSLVPYEYIVLESPTVENVKKAQMLIKQFELIEDSERKRFILGRLQSNMRLI